MPPTKLEGSITMKNRSFFIILGLILSIQTSFSFCGFYVAKAGAKLFNKSSQVVLVRSEDKTVLTMANDFQGDPVEFAIVIPVPTFLERGQIHVGDKAIIEHLDAYTSPRLVEYFDDDPCRPVMVREMRMFKSAARVEDSAATRAKSLGVTIEAQYTVGEYDIVILSAEQSNGLEIWLNENDYRIPQGAEKVLHSYIKQHMHFFVAKVNLEEQSKLGYTYLRPLQVAYESKKFMLPIRLGTINARGTQELFIYALTQKGRVETTNYQTVKLPTGMDIPVYVKNEFGDFYKAMFANQVKKEDMRAVFLEYAWNMNWCDPCAADPLSEKELKDLGVFWIKNGTRQNLQPTQPRGNQRNVYVTRLHLRYDAESFPEDLMFQETGNRQNFQGRYVLRHPWKGDINCDQADQYWESLYQRQEKEARTLANLTGWNINEIRRKMDLKKRQKQKPWWNQIWQD